MTFQSALLLLSLSVALLAASPAAVVAEPVCAVGCQDPRSPDPLAAKKAEMKARYEAQQRDAQVRDASATSVVAGGQGARYRINVGKESSQTLAGSDASSALSIQLTVVNGG